MNKVIKFHLSRLAMNIFYLHRVRRLCAQYHCDKHVVKMILETYQLLCTAVWLCDPNSVAQRGSLFYYHNTRIYRRTHANHPSAVWARENSKHFRWLRKFGLRLCTEYTYRYGREHVCEKYLRTLKTPPLPDGSFHPPPQCMPDQYKVDTGDPINDTIAAYRAYYNGDKVRILSWSGKRAGRPTPDWIVPVQTKTI